MRVSLSVGKRVRVRERESLSESVILNSSEIDSGNQSERE